MDTDHKATRKIWTISLGDVLSSIAIVISLVVFRSEINSEKESAATLNASKRALNTVVAELHAEQQVLRNVDAGLGSAVVTLRKLQSVANDELRTLAAEESTLANIVSINKTQYDVAQRTLTSSRGQNAQALTAAQHQYDLARKTLTVSQQQYDLVHAQAAEASRVARAVPDIQYNIQYRVGETAYYFPWTYVAEGKTVTFSVIPAPQVTLNMAQRNRGSGVLGSPSTVELSDAENEPSLAPDYESPCANVNAHRVSCRIGEQLPGTTSFWPFAINMASAQQVRLALHISLYGKTPTDVAYNKMSVINLVITKRVTP